MTGHCSEQTAVDTSTDADATPASAPRRGPHRRRRRVPAGSGPRPRRGDAPRRRVVRRSRPASSSRSSVRAAPARRRCWRRSPASPRPPPGSVRFDGVDVHANLRTFRGVIGYVPQDDIIHADLPLERTLRYAARLRLPSSTTRGRDRRRGPRRDRRRRPDRARRRPGRRAERRAAQARQHRGRAAHRPARLLPRRADVGPRPDHERGAGRPPARARRPVGDRRVHDALGRGPRAVRSHRVHGARRAGRLRRHRRRGARAASASTRSRELYRRLAERGRAIPRGRPVPPPRRRPTRRRDVDRRPVAERRSRSGACSPAGRSRRSCATA